MKIWVSVVFSLLIVGCGPSPEEMEKAVHVPGQSDIALIKKILKKDASYATHRDKNESTPLHTVGSLDVATLLIDKGADVRATDRFGRTPLHTTQNWEIAELLISKGANVNAQSQKKQMPIHTATTGDIAQLLLNKGAHVNQPVGENIGFKSPLYYAVASGHADVVSVLIQNGANVHETNHKNDTYLHLAAKNNRARVVDALVDAGVGVDSRAKYSATPLHYAALDNHVEVAEALINRGADIYAELAKGTSLVKHEPLRVGPWTPREKNVGGETVLSIATSGKFKALLKKHGLAH